MSTKPSQPRRLFISTNSFSERMDYLVNVKCAAISLFLLSLSTANAQHNLVPNPSFEEYKKCPYELGYFIQDFVNEWRSVLASPDFFNACTGEYYFGVPNNVVGWQAAHTGKAYVGLALVSTWQPHFKEVIGTRLTEPLQKDSTYCARFYAVQAEDFAGCATANMGIFLTADSLTTLDIVVPLDSVTYWPQMMHDTTVLIWDTINWTPVQGKFKAQGGERFLYLGNFFPDSLTNFFVTGINSDDCYYFIDDVGVYKNECPVGLDVVGENQLLLYPNPGNTSFNCGYLLKEKERGVIQITDVLGKIISETVAEKTVTTVSTKSFSNGLYFVSMLVNSIPVATEKWIKQSD